MDIQVFKVHSHCRIVVAKAVAVLGFAPWTFLSFPYLKERGLGQEKSNLFLILFLKHNEKNSLVINKDN